MASLGRGPKWWRSRCASPPPPDSDLSTSRVRYSRPHRPTSEVLCRRRRGRLLAGGDVQQAADGNAAEPHRLLKAVADAQRARSVTDLGVMSWLSGGFCRSWGFDAGDKLGEGGLAAPVRAGDDRQFPLGHGEAHVPHNLAAAGAVQEMCCSSSIVGVPSFCPVPGLSIRGVAPLASARGRAGQFAPGDGALNAASVRGQRTCAP